MTILRYLPILLVSATAYAQAGLTWVLSPINNHIYARTSPMTWPQAEALAVQLGGHLATIRNSQENQWVFQSFGSNVWIGFNDRANEVSWVWSSGEPVTYTQWLGSEPNNANNEDSACLWSGGSAWNDYNEGIPQPSIIELPGGLSAPIRTEAISGTTPPPALTDHATSGLPSSGALLFGGTTSTGPFFVSFET